MNPARRALLGSFKHDETARFLAVLLRVARADDVSPTERDHLQPVAEWLEASPEQLSEAVRLANDPTLGLSELVSGFQHGNKGLLLFRECCAVVWVDMRKTQEESRLLDELARLVGITESARAVLDAPIVCSPEGERRFLSLIGVDQD